MDKKVVSFFCWSSNDGEYLFKGNCFEEELLKEYEECLKANWCKNEKWLSLLINEVNKGGKHAQDILDEIFRENTKLHYSFSEKLNLFDIIEVECFASKNEIGDAIIHLCGLCGMRFIVSRKGYRSINEMWIDFEVCHEDYDHDCHKALVNQSIHK